MHDSNTSYENVLKFWFGHVEETIVPTEHRARIWFGDDETIDQEIQWRFTDDLNAVTNGTLNEWLKSPRGRLATVIVLDQFSRHIYRKSPQAFEQDERALKICLEGMKAESDHSLSLIERVFYYFPLLHSEKIMYQEQSVMAYRTLVELAFAETRVIFDSFLKFANHHYSIIHRFGRFPQRNIALQRVSSKAELDFLKEIGEE